MASKADPNAVRKVLDQARSQRNQIVRGAPLPIDTAHLVGSCVNCGRLGFTVLGFPDPSYAGPPGQPRFRNARELERFLQDLVQRPPPMPGPEDKGQQQNAVCACGAPADPREVEGVRFLHAMPGTGAELIVEGMRSAGSLLVSAAGSPLGGSEEFRWKVFKAPLDGIEADVPGGFDDAGIEKVFGRALTLAHTFKGLLDGAAAGKGAVLEVEPGYWIYAGAPEDAELQGKIDALTKDNPERGAWDLVDLGKDVPLPQGPAWPLWAHEHAQALADKKLRAGAIMDRAIVRKLITAQLGRLNIQSLEDEGGKMLVAVLADGRWPIEIEIVSRGAAHLGWTMAETVAAAVGEAAARVQVLAQYFQESKRLKPDVTWQVEGMRATPVRKDQSKGRPVNLAVTPFRFQPNTPEFERELKFVVDDLPKGADATRGCPCGAKAFVAARLFPWNIVEEFKRSTDGKTPHIVEKYPEENPKAALLATISCDMHVRIPGSWEIEGAGLRGNDFDKRLASDLANSVFAVDVSLHEDKSKKRALLAYGPLVASVVMNDHLVSALHEACGKPLRADTVEAQVTTPNVLCMYEPGFDDDMLDKVLEAGGQADGIPPGMATPFSLTWDVNLKAAPVGKFMNLYPPPDQQQQPGAPPPNRPPPGGRGQPRAR